MANNISTLSGTLRQPKDESKGVSGFEMIDNYIYVYHTGMLVSIPLFPDQLQDEMQVSYNTTDILTRSAPIFSYKHSGPRKMNIALKLHRDLMCNIKYLTTDMHTKIIGGENSLKDMDEDYVDVLVRELQACAVPMYAASEKMVDPPMVAIRFGNDVYIKGVVDGSVGVTYSGPILRTNKYALVDVAFNVAEVDPYDASQIMEFGSFRGINTTLERNIWTESAGTSTAVGGGTRAMSMRSIQA